MSNLLSYKNYNGTVEYSKEDNCLFGKVIGVKSLLSYEGNSVKELEQDFQNVVDEYLEDCKERDIEPEISYKGGTIPITQFGGLHKLWDSPLISPLLYLHIF